MKKAILEFDLSDEDQLEDFEKIMKAPQAFSTISEFFLKLRKIIKYSEGLTEEQMNVYEECRKIMFECCEENCLSELI